MFYSCQTAKDRAPDGLTCLTFFFCLLGVGGEREEASEQVAGRRGGTGAGRMSAGRGLGL